jgi:AbiV family abortive infection protein
VAKPKYTRSEKALISGYSKIRDTALELYKSAKILKEYGNITQSTSLSVLALEECGKLFLFDSLLFSTKNDEYEATFRKCFGSHVSKIDALQFFPMLLVKFGKADPRYKNNSQFRSNVDTELPKAVMIFREMRDHLDSCDLRNIDKIKQNCFYSSLSNNGFATPSDAICAEDHERIFNCIEAYSHLLDEIISDRAINHQINMARSVRGFMTAEDWDKLRLSVHQYQETLWKEAFEFADMSSNSKMH